MILAAVALVCCASALALDPSLDVNQYAHTAWKIRDGFTKGGIRSIAQGPDGYLWLGTEFGVARFDGVRAVPWQLPAGQQLPSNFIFSLRFARDGTLWIGTGNGLAGWKDGKLSIYPELTGFQVGRLFEDSMGTVWVGTIRTPKRAKLCSIRNTQMECHGGDGTLGDEIYGLYEDTQRNLWVGVQNGFWRWRPGPSKFFPAPADNTGIRGFAEDDQHTLLVAAKGGLRRLVNGRLEAHPLPYREPMDSVYRMFRDRDGGLWIATLTHGLVHVHRGRVDMFSASDGLSGNSIWNVVEDRESNIWTLGPAGIDRFREYSISTLSTNQGVSSHVVFSVAAASDGTVRFATPDGLDVWEHGRISVLRPSDGAWSPGGPLYGAADPKYLFEDSSGRFWVSTFGEFGYLEDSRYVRVGGYPGGNAIGIAEGTPGHLWVANREFGLLQVSQGKVAQELPWRGLGFEQYASALVTDPVTKGLWLGFWDGGIAYIAENKVQASYSAADGLGRGKVTHLYFDSHGTLWAATDGGLSRIEKGHISTLTSRNGLPCDTAYWTIEDNDRALWLSMSCGLVRIGRDQLDVWAAEPNRTIDARVLDASDGVWPQFWVGEYGSNVTKARDGKIWFVTSEGVSVLDPHHLPINRVPAPVHIEQIVADDKPYYPAAGLHWSSRIYYLAIHYTAPSFSVPEKVRFRFRLEGLDPEWREVVNDREVQYSNLSPGHYRFRVIAANNSGVWNYEGDTLEFDVLPAWYQTAWFRLFYIAAGGMLFWLLYRLRLRQMTDRVRLRYTERLAERTRIARELHDTLLQNLAGVSLQLDGIAKQAASHPERAVPLIGQVREQVDASFQEARVQVWNLRSTSLEGPGLAVTLQQFCERIGPPSSTARCEFHLVGQPYPLPAECEEELLRIAQEATHNAVRHAHSNQIRVVLEYAVKWLRLSICDDGQGFDLQEGLRKADHWGLKNMQERAAQIHATCQITSSAGKGTRVQVKVPLPLKGGRLATT